jgi:hypothetical protein
MRINAPAHWTNRDHDTATALPTMKASFAHQDGAADIPGLRDVVSPMRRRDRGWRWANDRIS